MHPATTALHPLLPLAALRAVERAALAEVPAGTLMARAGAAAAALCLQVGSDRPGPVWIIAGPGNNGGDALVVARALAAAGLQLEVALLADPAAYQGDAAAAWSAWGGPHRRDLGDLEEAALIVDGLFGIGLNRALPDAARLWVERINRVARRRGCPVIALDVPSGLNADTGAVTGGVAVHADHTITFIADKPGLHTLDGPDHAGAVHIATLGLALPASAGCLNQPAAFASRARSRPRNSHKGQFGSLAIVGGSSGMTGAALLAGRMALMAGAGRVYVQCLDAAAPAFDGQHPELMLRRHLDGITLDAAVIGCGLGDGALAREQLAGHLVSSLPLVLDADALNLIGADGALMSSLAARHAPGIITPHPLEAARLLGQSVASVQADRVAAALELARRCQAVAVLKGAGSVIATPTGQWSINATGNPALATAGTGDILAGLAGALLAQGWAAPDAALASVWLHGTAADDLVAHGIGPIGMAASELIVAVRHRLNQLVHTSRPA